MEKIDYEKEFLSIYNKFNQKYSKWEVWKDFLYLSENDPTPKQSACLNCAKR